jgi:hypothetical protein
MLRASFVLVLAVLAASASGSRGRVDQTLRSSATVVDVSATDLVVGRAAASLPSSPSFRSSPSQSLLASPGARVVRPPPLRPRPAEPAPPTETERRTFRTLVVDDDVQRIPPCGRAGLATTACRDPMSYLTSNERRQDVWLPFITNVGGGFVGVGADQAYALAAAARSEWVWIVDYDVQVVRLHRLVQVLIAEAETPDAFVALFRRSAAATTRARLKRLLADDADGVAVVRLFEQARPRLLEHYRRQQVDAVSPDFGWLNDPGRYVFVRRLVEQGRVTAVAGNLLTDKTLPAIAAAARALRVPIRLYYPSNAEEMWSFTPQYRSNVLALPFDEQSVVLRTLFNKRGPWDDVHSYWHYVVHKGIDVHQTLADEHWRSVRDLMRRRRPTAEPILSAIGFP